MLRASLLLPLLLLLSCSDRDLCAESPLCEKDQAINCEPACTVGPCSTGPHVLSCGGSATCTIVPGDLGSARFHRSRALCVEDDSEVCEPATAPPPVCEGQGHIVGCSEYKRVIRASCSQAALYFTNTDCCRGGGGGQADGGTPDGGAPTDGGR